MLKTYNIDLQLIIIMSEEQFYAETAVNKGV